MESEDGILLVLILGYIQKNSARSKIKIAYFSFSIKFTFSYQTNITERTAKEVLIRSVGNTKSKGTSTCCILLLDEKNKQIHSSYIGDSLYIILRYKKDGFAIEFKSIEQIHRFNTPYQVGTKGDSPDLAISNSHEINDKDVLIVASDG